VNIDGMIIGRGKPKRSQRNLSQCHFFHHRSENKYTIIELGPLAVGNRGLTFSFKVQPAVFYYARRNIFKLSNFT
jgi:hypothetical protein